ncbi:MAG: NADH:flavin oxidoreductase, partial [Lentisphaerae bacterium]|nr:NADH:flavin oxidoreductase [Lentisphaerota bacterium]
MAEYRKVTAFKTVAEFRDYLASEGIAIGLVDSVPADGRAALAQPIQCLGRTVGNRWAILPMEGWDCMDDGTPSEFTRRRWLRFATSGAKMIFGTEAAAVMHSGRSNPQQLFIGDHSLPTLKALCAEMRAAHRERFGCDDDLLIGLQLTHSGRYSHPNDAHTL